MKRILCIWLPDWPIQRLTTARPELNDKPLVVWESCRGSRQVAASSARAKVLGVTVGMPLAEATALMKGPGARGQGAPGGGQHSAINNQQSTISNQLSAISFQQSPLTRLHLEPYDPGADREALEKLAWWCHRFSPLVGPDDSPTPDSLLLDLTGLERLFGTEDARAAEIIRQFARRGLTARAAVADTVGAAWAVAHFGQSGEAGQLQTVNCKLQIANCKLQLPHSQSSILNPQSSILNPQSSIPNPQSSISNPQSPIFLVPPGGASAALRPLPMEALRLPDEVVELLHQLGMDRIGQLESLPREDLAARFGLELIRRLDQATGRLAEPVAAQQPSPRLEAHCSLEHPTTRRRTIELVLEQLIGQVAGALIGCGWGAMRLECRLICQPAGSVDLSVGLFQPTAAARHLFGLVQMRLQRAWLPGAVSAVHVQVTTAAPLAGRQQGLFSDGPPERHRRQLADLVDRLSSQLGRRSVVRVRLLADAQPELAYQYDPLTGTGPDRSRPGGLLRLSPRRARRSSAGAGPVDLPPRPLRLVRRAIPLAAVSIIPDGPPLRFPLETRQHRIAQVWGPERIETGWWRGRPVGRDYYRVETTAGARYWLFRRLRDGRWFLHGLFE